MRIITISAHAQHGKDFTATMIKSKLENQNYKVLIAHNADLLKYICKTFFNWDGLKDEQGRTLLQQVGTEGIRYQDPDFWINFIINILKFFPNEWDYVIIPDTRFPNEITRLYEENFNVVTVKVVRPNFDNGLTNEQKNHSSETSLDDFLFHYELTNNSTYKDMEETVDTFLSSMLGE